MDAVIFHEDHSFGEQWTVGSIKWMLLILSLLMSFGTDQTRECVRIDKLAKSEEEMNFLEQKLLGDIS